jgi:hypothetical protein
MSKLSLIPLAGESMNQGASGAFNSQIQIKQGGIKVKVKLKVLTVFALVFLFSAVLCPAVAAKDLIRNSTFDDGVGLP